MFIKNENTLLAIGMFSMALGILIGRFLNFEYLGFAITDFIEGLLLGVSLVLNLTYLIKTRSRKQD